MKEVFTFKSIGARITFGFVIVILLFLVYAAYNVFSIHKTNEAMRHAIDYELELLIVDEALVTNMAERGIITWLFIIR